MGKNSIKIVLWSESGIAIALGRNPTADRVLLWRVLACVHFGKHQRNLARGALIHAKLFETPREIAYL